jgi:hypothetical protein
MLPKIQNKQVFHKKQKTKNIYLLVFFFNKKNFLKNNTSSINNFFKQINSQVSPILPILTEVVQYNKYFYKLDYVYVSNLFLRKKLNFKFFFSNYNLLNSSKNTKKFLFLNKEETNKNISTTKQYFINFFL